jgi:hypothetical protein
VEVSHRGVLDVTTIRPPAEPPPYPSSLPPSPSIVSLDSSPQPKPDDSESAVTYLYCRAKHHRHTLEAGKQPMIDRTSPFRMNRRLRHFVQRIERHDGQPTLPVNVTDSDISSIRMSLLEEYDDLLQPTPLTLPPPREILHEINLVDPKAKYHYHLPCCPEALCPALSEKIERYTKAGWWFEGTSSQAAPMMCICKPDERLCAVVDCWARNTNTVKDVTPFPDQDSIRTDLAHAKYRTKLDLADTYEQIRICENHVAHTVRHSVWGLL